MNLVMKKRWLMGFLLMLMLCAISLLSVGFGNANASADLVGKTGNGRLRLLQWSSNGGYYAAHKTPVNVAENEDLVIEYDFLERGATLYFGLGIGLGFENNAFTTNQDVYSEIIWLNGANQIQPGYQLMNAVTLKPDYIIDNISRSEDVKEFMNTHGTFVGFPVANGYSYGFNFFEGIVNSSFRKNFKDIGITYKHIYRASGGYECWAKLIGSSTYTKILNTPDLLPGTDEKIFANRSGNIGFFFHDDSKNSWVEIDNFKVSTKTNDIETVAIEESYDSTSVATKYNTNKWGYTIGGATTLKFANDINFDYDLKTISLQNLSQTATAQFWVKEKVSLQWADDSYIWVLKQNFDFLEPLTFEYETAFANDDMLSVLIRVKENNIITDYFKVFNKKDYVSIIDKVIVESEVFNKNETIYLPNKAATLGLTFVSTTPATITVDNGQYANGTITFNDFDNLGIQYLNVSIGDTTETLKVYVYDSEGSSYIKNVSINQDLTEKTVSILAEKEEKLGTESVLTYSFAKISNANGQFDLSDSKYTYGYYFYQVSLMVGTKKLDTYYGYFYYGDNALENISETLNLDKDIDATIAISATLQEDKIYQFFKWDAKGEYLVKDFSEDNSCNFTPLENGTYMFEIRIKSLNAECIYEQIKYVTVNVSTQAFTNNLNIVTSDNLQANKANTINAVLDVENSSVMYKYIIKAKGMWKVIEFYSPSNSMAWVPTKPGEYTIEVRVLNQNSFGYFDISKTLNVTVI